MFAEMPNYLLMQRYLTIAQIKRFVALKFCLVIQQTGLDENAIYFLH